MTLSNQGKKMQCRRRLRRRQPNDTSFLTTLLSLALSLSSSSARQRLAPPLSEREVTTTIATAATVTTDGSATSTFTDMKIIGSYGPRKHNKRNGLTSPSSIDYTKLSRINYGPFAINNAGSIWDSDVNAMPTQLYGPRNWNPDEDATQYCSFASSDMANKVCAAYLYEEGLMDRAHQKNVTVYSVIGGVGYEEEFGMVASDPEAREKFAQNAVSLMVEYGFDGLDIAWQFPNSTEEMSNYGVLLSEVREALDNEGIIQNQIFGLTAPVPCSHEHMENIDIRFLDKILSEFNLLSVDFVDPNQDSKVGVNSPLYSRQGYEEGNSINTCVMRYIEGGATREKINIGLAFYGHSFQGGTTIGSDCTANWAGSCADTKTWQDDAGSPLYHNIYTNMPDLSVEFDMATMTPLATNQYGVVSYDDPRSICLKTEYAIANRLNGFVVMDLTDDMLENKFTPLLDTINFKLAEPGLDCGGSEFEELFAWKAVGTGSLELANSDSEEEEPEVVFYGEYRYTCGIGQGNARESCSNEAVVDINCDFGQCPDGQFCYVVFCTKPRDFVVLEPWQLLEQEEGNKMDTEEQAEEEEGPVTWTHPEASFVKAKSKPKPKGRPKRPNATSTNPVKLTRPVPSSSLVDGKLTPTRAEMKMAVADKARGPPANSILGNMRFSCGVNHDHAKGCGTPCPNGINDCPSGHFCFWLECVEEPSVADAIEVPEVTELQYHCGATRDDALTCSNECGFAWACPDGTDCYNVPCFI